MKSWNNRITAIIVAIASILTNELVRAAVVTLGPLEGPGGHFYEIVVLPDRVLDWEEANSEANLRSFRGASGHLATITSGAEDLFIDELRKEALLLAGFPNDDPVKSPQLWVGGVQAPNQPEINQGWSWINGEGPIPETNFDPGYANWVGGEPNDFVLTEDIEDNEENHLTVGIRGFFGWNDEGLSLFLTHGYVVEYDAPECLITFGPIEGPDGHHYEILIGCDWSVYEADLEASARTYFGSTGHLATITAHEEDEFIEEFRQTVLMELGIDPFDMDEAPQWWIGGFQDPDQQESNQGWFWVNGEGSIPETNGDPGYANWLPGEPNDALFTPGIEDNEEDFLTIGLFGQFGWNDEGFNLGGLVVEYDSPGDDEGPAVGVEPLGDDFWRLSATDNEDPDPSIFIYDDGSGEFSGPYADGTIIRLKASTNPNKKSKDKKRYSEIPHLGVPIVTGWDEHQNMAPPIVVPLDEPIGNRQLKHHGGIVIPKAATTARTMTFPGTVSINSGSEIMGIQSFGFHFQNGDHHISQLTLKPEVVLPGGAFRSGRMNLSDDDRGVFGNEGDDPVRYDFSGCDLHDIGTLISTGDFPCTGGTSLIPLPRAIRSDETVGLAGFSFRTVGSNHHLREIEVMPLPSINMVRVGFGDDDGEDDYVVSVDLIVLPSSMISFDQAVLIGPLGADAGGMFSFPFAGSGAPLIQGFQFRFSGNDRHLERIAIDFDIPNICTLIFHENGADVGFEARIDWVGLAVARP